MAIQIVMDRTGDTRHVFDAADKASVSRAERRFMELTARGFRAAALGEEGASDRMIDKFDPLVERTLFIPHLKGG